MSGTGDSAIIDLGDREIIIDGGNSPTVLRNYIQARNLIDGPVELVVVTHWRHRPLERSESADELRREWAQPTEGPGI
jgi:hypothetical protein